MHLKTKLYNKYYYDFINHRLKSGRYLPFPDKTAWTAILGKIDPAGERHMRFKQILADQNRDLHSGPASKYLQQLSDPHSLIVITGQQLGLIGSPLYTIFKILTTIRLSEQLNTHYSKYRFIPVFWLESEDHDFTEINNTGIFDQAFQPQKLTYQGKNRGKVSIRHYQLETEITRFLSELAALLQETEFSSDLMGELKKSYLAGNSWLQATRDYLKRLFESHGILFFKPGDLLIKNQSVEFFHSLIDRHHQLSECFTLQSAFLAGQGYPNQVTNIEGKTFIHIEQDDLQRAHLYQKDDHYYFQDDDRIITSEGIKQLIRNEPQKVSTSVISRPLLQSWFFPVAAYVAGPAEVAYWAQMLGMFGELDLVMPLVYPRVSATLLEPKIVRYLKKHDIDQANIPVKYEQFSQDFYRAIKKAHVEDPVNQIRQIISVKGDDIYAYLQALDPTLVDSGRKTIERIEQSLKHLETRVLKAIERQENQLSNHLQQIHAAFFPLGMPQERFLTIIYFLNKFGPAFLDDMYGKIEIESFRHQIIEL